VEFLVSNFLANDKCWAGDLLQEEAIIRYKDRMKVLQSLSYTFQNDCQILKEHCDNPNDLLKTDGDYPKLLTLTLQKVVQFESLCIMDSLLNFTPMWNKKIADTIRYPEISRKIRKYKPFLHYDKDKMKSILVKELL
jgi:hypothetical protein